MMQRLLALGLCLPLALRAQASDSRIDRLSSPLRDSVALVMDSAREAGLPTGPLLQKALEGTAKQASVPSVMRAVRALSDALRVSRAALGSPSSPDELSAAAVALRMGARPSDLTKLRLARPVRSLVVPLAVLSDLVARGVPADTATHVVIALAGSADDQDYMAFRRSVDRDIDLGVPPGSSAFGQLNVSARALLNPAKKP